MKNIGSTLDIQSQPIKTSHDDDDDDVYVRKADDDDDDDDGLIAVLSLFLTATGPDASEVTHH